MNFENCSFKIHPIEAKVISAQTITNKLNHFPILRWKLNDFQKDKTFFRFQIFYAFNYITLI